MRGLDTLAVRIIRRIGAGYSKHTDRFSQLRIDPAEMGAPGHEMGAGIGPTGVPMDATRIHIQRMRAYIPTTGIHNDWMRTHIAVTGTRVKRMQARISAMGIHIEGMWARIPSM